MTKTAYTVSGSRRPHDGYIIRVAAKSSDIFLNPLQGHIHVLEAKIEQTFFLG